MANLTYALNCGVGMSYYSVMTNIGDKDTKPTYEAVKPLGEIVEISIDSSQDSQKFYAGDRCILQYDNDYKGSGTLTLPSLSPAQKADLLGYKKTADGGYIRSREKKNIALMLELHSVNNETRKEVTDYVTLFNVTVQESQIQGKTAEDNFEFSNVQLSFEAETVPHKDYTDFKYIVSDDDESFNADTFGAIWGKTVPEITLAE